MVEQRMGISGGERPTRESRFNSMLEEEEEGQLARRC